MKGEENLRITLGAIARSGRTGIGLADLTRSTGLNRSTVRTILDRHVYTGIIAIDRTACPIKHTVSQTWEEELEKYQAAHSKKMRDHGRNMQEKYSAERMNAIRERVKNPNAPARDISQMLAACQAQRPGVRTTWRGPAPQWAGV